MREFDPATQRSAEKFQHLELTPAREGIPTYLTKTPEHESELHEFYLPGINPEPNGFLDTCHGIPSCFWTSYRS